MEKFVEPKKLSKKAKKSLTRKIEYGIIYQMAVYIRQRKIMIEKKLKKICEKC